MNALVIVHLLRCQAKAILAAMPQESHPHLSKRHRKFPRSQPRLEALTALPDAALEPIQEMPWHKVG